MHIRLPYILLGVAAAMLCLYLVWNSLVRSTLRPLPEGVQTLTGTLIPVELSLTRRGTHLLKVEGEEVVYVESAAVNLRQYELMDVGVTGRFTRNTDPSDAPVLVVTSLRPVEIPARSVDVPPVGLTLRVPLDWTIRLFDDGVAFSFTGSNTPFLRVMRSSLTHLPSGTPIVVAGYDAVRETSLSGEDIVHMMAGRIVVTFTWVSQDNAALSAEVAQMLRTAIVRAPTASSSAQSGSIASFAGGSASLGTSQPCGGPAGVLCPAGSFCAVTDVDGVGTCVLLR